MTPPSHALPATLRQDRRWQARRTYDVGEDIEAHLCIYAPLTPFNPLALAIGREAAYSLHSRVSLTLSGCYSAPWTS